MRRETFYEAQRRHRRSTWRFSILSAMAVLLLGLPLSVIVSPFMSAMGLVALDLIDVAVPMPDPAADIGRVLERLFQSEAERAAGETVHVPARAVVAVAVALVVPGMVLMAAAWLCVRRLFLRSGAGAVVLAAGARPPRPGDVEERQLVNLVEEMAIAAGVPPPRVMILDADLANAAVVGRSIHDATLIVPRRMLDDLGRGPTGAIVADLLAVVVNGDLRIALVVASVFQTFDLVGAALTAPFSRRTRQVLWRLLRLALRPRSRSDGTEAHFIAVELAEVAQLGGGDAGLGADELNGGCLKLGLQFPFFVASIAYTLTRMIPGSLLVTPVMAALWRRRRLLADATAVELTRDPDSLLRALEHLQGHGATVPAGPWTHLFVVGPEVARERARRRFEQRRDDVWEADRQPGETRAAAFRRQARAALEASADYRRDTAAAATPAAPAGMPTTESGTGTLPAADDGSAELAGFLPPISTRLERLAAMSGGPDTRPGRPPRRRASSPLIVVATWIVGLVLVAILLALFLMLLACIAAMVYLALLFELLLLAPPVILIHVLLR